MDVIQRRLWTDGEAAMVLSMTKLRVFCMVAPMTLCLGLAACDSGDNDGATGPGEDETGESSGEESGDTGGESGSEDLGDGDGDGDTPDTTDTTDTDMDTGPGEGDGPAQAACQAFEGATPQPLVAATSAAEAATAPIVPNGQAVYQVTLPEGAAGFIELQIPDWETTQAFFTNEDIDYTVTVESNSQVPGPREPDAACPEAGITDQRIFFPHWTPATIEFSATGPREIMLMVIEQL